LRPPAACGRCTQRGTALAQSPRAQRRANRSDNGGNDKMMTKVRAISPRSWVTAALAGALALAALPSAANPVFGPDVFPKISTSGTSDVYTANVTIPANGFYMVWMHNGDEGSDRITSGSVTLTGTTLITAANDMSFQQAREFFWRPVFLVSGSHTLTVTLTNG